jgi:hypothetical protein
MVKRHAEILLKMSNPQKRMAEYYSSTATNIVNRGRTMTDDYRDNYERFIFPFLFIEDEIRCEDLVTDENVTLDNYDEITEKYFYNPNDPYLLLLSDIQNDAKKINAILYFKMKEAEKEDRRKYIASIIATINGDEFSLAIFKAYTAKKFVPEPSMDVYETYVSQREHYKKELSRKRELTRRKSISKSDVDEMLEALFRFDIFSDEEVYELIEIWKKERDAIAKNIVKPFQRSKEELMKELLKTPVKKEFVSSTDDSQLSIDSDIKPYTPEDGSAGESSQVDQKNDFPPYISYGEVTTKDNNPLKTTPFDSKTNELTNDQYTLTDLDTEQYKPVIGVEDLVKEEPTFSQMIDEIINTPIETSKKPRPVRIKPRSEIKPILDKNLGEIIQHAEEPKEIISAVEPSPVIYQKLDELYLPVDEPSTADFEQNNIEISSDSKNSSDVELEYATRMILDIIDYGYSNGHTTEQIAEAIGKNPDLNAIKNKSNVSEKGNVK